MAESLLLSSLFKNQTMDKTVREMEKVIKDLKEALRRCEKKFQPKGKSDAPPKMSREAMEVILRELHVTDQLLLKLRLKVDECSNHSVWSQKQLRIVQSHNLVE